MIRKLFFWCHLVAGLAVGLIVLALCLTGALLTYERASFDWMDRSALAAPPAGQSVPLPADELVARVAKAAHAQPRNLRYLNDPNAPVRIQMGNGSFICANAYTGELIGPSAPGLRKFYQTMRHLHTTLTFQKDESPTGGFIVGACNIVFVFLTLTGLILWWPSKWSWKSLRSILVPRLRLSGKARDWNWHNALGFWGLIPLFIMSATGIVLSYGAVDKSVRQFAREHVFAKQAAPLTRPVPAPVASAGKTDWRKVLASAQEAVPGWRSLTVPWNLDSKPQVSIQITPAQEGEAMRSIGLTIDKATATVVKEQRWENAEAGVRARYIMRLGHSGELGGLAGQTLAGLGCVAGLFLVYTGFALSWRRFFSWRRRKKIAVATATQAAELQVSGS